MFVKEGQMMTISETIAQITPPDRAAMDKAWQIWDNKCIPLRSLGKLEEMVVRLCGIFGTTAPKIHKRAVVVMAGDNGVLEENVTQSDHQVTTTVTCNMTKANATICVLSKLAGADVFPVDIGILDDVDCPGVYKRNVMHGTANMTKGPAMPREKAEEAVETGIRFVSELVDAGYNLFATGEMGIGNTTTSSAMASVLLDVAPEKVTGRGAGLSTPGLERKINAIKKAIEVNRPDKHDPMDVLAKVGGLDIAGLCGCFIGAAARKVPILIDGFISSVAALCAVRMAPGAIDYIFPSHVSAEPAGAMVLETMGLEAVLHADMCLGEGSGAVTCFQLFDYALTAYEQIPTFEVAEIETYVPLA